MKKKRTKAEKRLHRMQQHLTYEQKIERYGDHFLSIVREFHELLLKKEKKCDDPQQAAEMLQTTACLCELGWNIALACENVLEIKEYIQKNVQAGFDGDQALADVVAIAATVKRRNFPDDDLMIEEVEVTLNEDDEPVIRLQWEDDAEEFDPLLDLPDEMLLNSLPCSAGLIPAADARIAKLNCV